MNGDLELWAFVAIYNSQSLQHRVEETGREIGIERSNNRLLQEIERIQPLGLGVGLSPKRPIDTSHSRDHA
jgi:hypothetical protein